MPELIVIFCLCGYFKYFKFLFVSMRNYPSPLSELKQYGDPNSKIKKMHYNASLQIINSPKYKEKIIGDSENSQFFTGKLTLSKHQSGHSSKYESKPSAQSKLGLLMNPSRYENIIKPKPVWKT